MSHPGSQAVSVGGRVVLFVCVTHAVSRRQELAADALAARVVGACAPIEGLKRVCGGAAAYAAYWQHEAQPISSQGYRILMGEGFGHYLRAAPILRVVRSHVDRELAEAKGDPHDTHPCLRDRIEPLDVVRELRSGERSKEAWAEFCARHDVASLRLQPDAAAADPAPASGAPRRDRS